MPDDCAVKTLELVSGVHSGAGNVKVGVFGNESVALVGHQGAIIDGGDESWLLSVTGNGSLVVTNLTLQHGFLPDGSSMYGAALSVVGQGVLHARGVQFFDNAAAGPGGRGGAVLVYDTGIDASIWLDAHFVGCTWERNKAGAAGGGMFAASACPGFEGCMWRNNSVDSDSGTGGGLVISHDSSVEGAPQPTFGNCTFEFNHVGGDGGGTVVQLASPSFDRCLWHHNMGGTGGSGGGLSLKGDGRVVKQLPQFMYCTFELNSAGSAGGGTFVLSVSIITSYCVWCSNTVGERGVGGGLAMVRVGSPACFFYCIFKFNSAGDSGGGAFALQASPSFTGCIWHGNIAGEGGNGGGLELQNLGEPVFTNCTFDLNVAGVQGGGTYVECSSPSFTGCVWHGNSVTQWGGGLVLNDNSAHCCSLVTNCSFKYNTAQVGGGAIVSNTSPSFVGCVWHNNKCLAQQGTGGGMCIVDASPFFFNCTWHSNSVGDHGYGGGLYWITHPYVAVQVQEPALTSCIFKFNRAGVMGLGGGMSVQETSPSFTNCSWSSNVVGHAGYGGGIAMNGESLVKADEDQKSIFMNCMFEVNAATGGYGGGTSIQFASPSFSGSRWLGNTGAGGGGLDISSYHATTSTLPSVISNCVFTRNIANVLGGAVDATSCSFLHFVGVIFIQNEAGLQNEFGTVATSYGGAVYFEATAGLKSPGQILVYFANCLFDSNSAPLGHGGALFLSVDPKAVVADAETKSAAVCILLGTEFVNNRASATGGAVQTNFPSDTPSNLRFYDDSCPGVVCISPSTPSENTAPALFANNTARTWDHTAILQLTDTVFQKNHAGTNGGALAITNGGVVLTNVNLTENSADLHGGALYLDGTASLSACKTVWVRNIVNSRGLASSADGQHLYAASGAGAWNFSGQTSFEHADTNAAGLSAAKTDGVHGLIDNESVVIVCPAGAVQTKHELWTSNFTAVSGEWRLEGGETTTITTVAFWNITVPKSCNGVPVANDAYCRLQPNVTTKNKTRCQAEYFGNFMCGNPPPVYPVMLYTTVNLGCKQCDRSEVALPAGNNIASSTARCERCPEDWTSSGAAVCDTGHVVQHKGWWHPAQDNVITHNTRFWECYEHEAGCLGSKSNTAGAPSFREQCAVGHTGPVCAQCKPDHAMVHAKCRPCSGDAWSNIGTVVLVALAVLVSVVTVVLYRKRLGITECMPTIKIIVSFYSLLAVLEQTVSVAWPAGFQSVLSGVKIAFASVIDLSSFACAIRIDWFQKVGCWIVALVLAQFAIAVSFAVQLCKFRATSTHEFQHANQTNDTGIAEEGTHSALAEALLPTRDAADAESEFAGKGQIKITAAWVFDTVFKSPRPPQLVNLYSTYVFNTMLFLYPFLSPAVTAVVNCREVAGMWWLEADYSIACFDSRWWVWAAIAITVIAIYVVGFPLVTLRFVILRKPAVAFISSGYRKDGSTVVLAWEVTEMLRKFLLTSALIFWSKGTCIQVTVAVLVSIFFLVFHVYHMPFVSAVDNWSQLLALVGLLLVYFMGLLIKVQPDLESRYGFDGILQVVASVVAGIVFVVPMFHKTRRMWIARQQQNATELMTCVNGDEQSAGQQLLPDLSPKNAVPRAELRAVQEQLRLEQELHEREHELREQEQKLNAELRQRDQTQISQLLALLAETGEGDLLS
jgi:hypothetical protein